MGWWDENFPDPAPLPTPAPTAPAGPGLQGQQSQIQEWYQKYLGRSASQDEINTHLGNPGGLGAVQKVIQGSPEAAAYHPPSAAPASDPARDAVMKAFAAKGIQPRDEADINYWIGKINGTGGMSDAGNASYWTQRMAQGQGGVGDYLERPENQNGPTPNNTGTPQLGRPNETGQIETPRSILPNETGQIVPDPTPTPVVNSYQPPTASAFVAYNPGPAPTPIAFRAPTAEEARNTPGYQDAIYQADQGIQRSAVAKAGLSGGLLKDLASYNIGAADQNYQNVFGNAFNANQALNSNNLNAYNATTGANLGAGNLNLAGSGQAFDQSYLPSWNAYLSNVAQGQFNQNFGLAQQGFNLGAQNQGFNQNLATNQFNLGAQNQGFNQWLGTNQFNLGAQNQGFNQDLANRQFDLGKQNQFWNQDFQSNLNHYNQWDNNQKTAFDQWYKQAQLGNPGNPYA